MKEFDYYSTPTSKYPDKDYMKSYKEYLFQDFDNFIGTRKQIDEREQKLLNEVKAHKNKLMFIYNEEKAKLNNRFKMDVFGHFEVKTNPKADKCFELAWDYGHSYGYSEVYNHFSRLVELIY